jgi:hypothetical protein
MSTSVIGLNTLASGQPAVATMKALVYRKGTDGIGRPSWEDQPRPTLQDASDAIVRITTRGPFRKRTIEHAKEGLGFAGT